MEFQRATPGETKFIPVGGRDWASWQPSDVRYFEQLKDILDGEPMPMFPQLDERASWFYEAIGNTSGMQGRIVGFGQVYLETARDKSGAWLDGARSYPPGRAAAVAAGRRHRGRFR